MTPRAPSASMVISLLKAWVLPHAMRDFRFLSSADLLAWTHVPASFATKWLGTQVAVSPRPPPLVCGRTCARSACPPIPPPFSTSLRSSVRCWHTPRGCRASWQELLRGDLRSADFARGRGRGSGEDPDSRCAGTTLNGWTAPTRSGSLSRRGARERGRAPLGVGCGRPRLGVYRWRRRRRRGGAERGRDFGC